MRSPWSSGEDSWVQPREGVPHRFRALCGKGGAFGYHRLPLLGSAHARSVFVKVLRRVSQRFPNEFGAFFVHSVVTPADDTITVIHRGVLFRGHRRCQRTADPSFSLAQNVARPAVHFGSRGRIGHPPKGASPASTGTMPSAYGHIRGLNLLKTYMHISTKITGFQ